MTGQESETELEVTDAAGTVPVLSGGLRTLLAALLVVSALAGAVKYPVSAQSGGRTTGGLSFHAADARAGQSRATDDDRIYALLLATQLHMAGKRFVLQSDTAAFHAQLESIDPKLDPRYADNPDLVAALHDYNATNRHSITLRPIKGAEHAVHVSRAALDRVFKHGFWRAFYAKYPDATGLARFARPGYSTDRNTAIGYCSFSRAGLAGFGRLVWLKKQNGNWVVVKTLSGWVS